MLRLLAEQLADGAPDVVLRAEPARADAPPFRLHLAEDLGELRLARPVGGAAAGLDVAGVIDLPGEVGEERGGALPVLGGVRSEERRVGKEGRSRWSADH